jgi:lipoic acid synthetase/lipoate-protein ligase A
MKYVVLPDERIHPLSFYLSIEDYLAQNMEDDDLLMLWQVEPSVIYGRNQVVENEVNLDYCREHGIRVYQRKSGGGCVYADKDNLMLSMVTTEDNVGFAFNRFVTMVLLVLRKMGIEATGTTNNDSMIGDRKLCGTACRKMPRGCIVHSTMLYDTNMEHMLNAITPGPEKLEKKGIQSVRQRITLLKDYTTLSLDEVKALIRETLCQGERRIELFTVDGLQFTDEMTGGRITAADVINCKQ